LGAATLGEAVRGGDGAPGGVRGRRWQCGLPGVAAVTGGGDGGGSRRRRQWGPAGEVGAAVGRAPGSSLNARAEENEPRGLSAGLIKQ
jgi:hypothetical protein